MSRSSIPQKTLEQVSKFKEMQRNEGHIRDILKKNSTNIPPEKIQQAFAVIDAHTRILDQQSALDSYNQVAQVISTLMTTDPDWNKDEATCEFIINKYYTVYTDETKIDPNNEQQKIMCENIKKFIINTCKSYYAVSKLDKDLLNVCNKNVSEAFQSILKIIDSIKTGAQQNRPTVADNKSSAAISAEMVENKGNVIDMQEKIKNKKDNEQKEEVTEKKEESVNNNQDTKKEV